MSILHFHILALVSISLLFYVSSENVNTEMTILFTLKLQLGNPEALWGWTNSSSTPCEWPEVTCIDGSVIELSLSNMNIAVPIPETIGDLKNLTYLDLSYNNIPGGFPTVLYNCSKLQTLDLSQNYFVGPIPNDIDRLSSLMYINFEANNFSGDIPPQIGNLSELQTLLLSANLFSGEIPKEIGKLSNLENLVLAYNEFVPAEIPEEFGLLKKLKFLYMKAVNLISSIPESFNNLSSIEQLDLSLNNLEGSLPSGLFSLRHLTYLYLFHNKLSGEIPRPVKALKLQDIDLAMNNLTGSIPEDFGQLKKLKVLNLFSNQMSGGVPPSIGLLPALMYFLVYANNFSGDIPSGIWTAAHLRGLMLSDNSFSGQLPNKLASNLLKLDISNNRFSGSVPRGLSTCTNLYAVKASNNRLSGNIPVEATSLTELTTLLLDGNQLSGEFPSTIVSWRALNTLDVSRNQFSGKIPASIGLLPNLSYLDLSENNFSGEIPSELGRAKLRTLNFSSNKLSGPIPDELNYPVYLNSFLNNSNFCVTTPVLNLPKCHSKHQDSKKLFSKFLPLIVVLPVFAFVSTLLFTLFVIRDHRIKKQNHDQTPWKLTIFQRVNFTEENILKNLIESNLIGSGGSGKVYRAPVDHAGTPVAVKRIWNNRKLDDMLEKQFAAEAQILGTIKHANIVKLLCCISREDSKLLVYEYMENHSLDRWLHRRRRSSPDASETNHYVLDWPTRMRIAIGAASGLCYMHHDFSPPIIHRDIKSSNVLLDSEMNAKIADFGLAKLLVKKGEPNTVSAVAGSFGYIAPEYAYTRKINKKVDVYSFGVVLLELVTGREPNHGDDHTNLAQWAWKQNTDGICIVDCLDNEILQPSVAEEMIKIFKLGVGCTNATSQNRPNMKEVLHVLRRCSTGSNE